MLRAGGLGLFGLGLDDVLGARQGRAAAGARPRSVILAFCPGAPSHIDTWDPKPDAPEQVRGEFATIATRTPGLRVCEHLPGLARALGQVLADPLDDPRRARARAGQPRDARRAPQAPANATERANRSTDWPNLGSVFAYARPAPPDLPTAVVLPTKLTFGGYSFPGQNAGFLGARYDPWHVEGDPNAPASSPPRSTSPRA